MINLTLRRASVADARALGRIYYAAEHAWLHEYYPDGWPSSWFQIVSPEEAGRSVASWIASSGRSAAFFVAEERGTPVGWSYVAPVDHGVAQLHALYVSPDLWGHGIGGALLDRAHEWFANEGYRRAVLWAVETNPRSRAFYERRGWRHDGTTDRRDAHPPLVRYVLEIPPAPSLPG